MTRVTLYSKADCCLCDEARAVIDAVAQDHSLLVDEVDISEDADLIRKYGELVPVVLLDGQPAYEYHVDERDFRERIAAAERATA